MLLEPSLGMLDKLSDRSTAAEVGAACGPRVLFVTAELNGVLKAGGLGEVSEALPLAMRGMCDVRVLIPGFPALRRRNDISVVKSMPGTAGLPPWSLGRTTSKVGMTLYVVLCDELYDRSGTPYAGNDGLDFIDNDIRFARLSLAAAEIADGAADPTWRPDVVHANDWTSAITLGYMRWRGCETPSILTIHNLAYQGLYDRGRLEALGIPDSAFDVQGVEFHGKLSFMKSGIVYASHVTTVSETYAHEITTHQHGCGLDGLLSARKSRGDLTGILNGIDERWSDCAEELLRGGQVADWKRRKAAEVRRLFGLSATIGPLFSIVSRLVHQKGIDLSISIADKIVGHGGQLVVTGKGDPEVEAAVRDLAKRYPESIGARIGFDDNEARSMFEGSDFLLMPSRFEPCGLSQMYAQSSAALPIACKTGGLAETIDDDRSGFLCDEPDQASLGQAVGRALTAFQSKQRMKAMRCHALSKRFEWADSARKYVGVYVAAAS